MKQKNTPRKGLARFIIFRDGGAWYAVCLEFNIIESGDTPQEAHLLLLDAVGGYIESARKFKDAGQILNQKTDSEYEKMWRQLSRGNSSIFSSGVFNLQGIIEQRAFAVA